MKDILHNQSALVAAIRTATDVESLVTTWKWDCLCNSVSFLYHSIADLPLKIHVEPVVRDVLLWTAECEALLSHASKSCKTLAQEYELLQVNVCIIFLYVSFFFHVPTRPMLILNGPASDPFSD